VVVNLGVNPLAKTQDLLVTGAGHRAVAAALKAAPGRLVDYDTHWASDLVGEGFATLGGVDIAPDVDLFWFLAQESPGLTPDVFNRFAHVRFAMPPQVSGLAGPDLFHVAVSPCSQRLATLWVNHFLVYSSAVLPPECAADFVVRDVGVARLWSRKAPVNQIGVALTDTPAGALSFDFRVRSEVKLTPKRDRLLLESPPGGRPFATAFNLSLIDKIECTGASASITDAHVVVTPHRGEPVRCEIVFLGTTGAIARLAGLRKPLGRSR
jgi:hypothetical protein